MVAAAPAIAPGRAQAQLWSALIASPEPASATMLGAASGTCAKVADFRLKCWLGAGLVERIGNRPARYRLLPKTERTPMPPIIKDGRALPRPVPAYQRLWRVMRVLRTFDLPQLRLTAGTTHRSTLGYVGLLQQTGYIRLQKLGNPRTGEVSRYLLIRNTGPKAPRETQLRVDGVTRRTLIDNNTSESFDVSAGAPSARRTYARPGTAPDVMDGGVS